MIELILSFFGNYLIEFMTTIIILALALRWISFTHSKRDEAYFSHFTRELSSTLDEDKTKGIKSDNVEDYLNNILGRVNKKLPDRNLRKDLKERKTKSAAEKKEEGISLKEYVGSKHGMIASIQNETSVFSSKTAPDFGQLTERVMNDDENWSKIFGIIPINGITRILDVLPTMFIVLGVFGTFIGISMALPEIARIDFNNLEASGETLTQFVINVTFAMKTSIAGIFFSIILTLLNTLFPIEGTREGTFEKVENGLQVLWYHLQTDPKKINMDKEIQAMRESIDAILEEIRHSKDVKKAG
ncbi:MAG: hypothetical protein WD025_02115 [Bacteriovoracaceae bacterium]